VSVFASIRQSTSRLASYAGLGGPEAAHPSGWAALATAAEEHVYRAERLTLAAWSAAGQRLWKALLTPGAPRPKAAELRALRRRFDAALAEDFHNAASGYYPRYLLYAVPLVEYASLLPRALLDLPLVLWRKHRGSYAVQAPAHGSGTYPPYYLRTFHWQTGGWLSDHSARLYDAGVEFLFAGTADVMRRLAIPSVVDRVRETNNPRILDVGCGTGRFLLQLAAAVPHAKLYGLDLSPNYLRRARKVLAGHDGVALVADDAENMPWASGFFDVVTSVFLMHELPPRVRRRVACEIARVLAPGGTVVICDSAQYGDGADVKGLLDAFPRAYHEPFYKGYLRDDLGRLLVDAGLEVEATRPALLSKVVVARKPVRTRLRSV